ncbi:thermonuclease family protein [Phyllobacterium salinisoli]|uniref:Thermonuclease family protein n=1 Tax=Phyllobacterium salinisoli TaxID=1899321 RepID=A0A368K9N0_9HYPH|nr:thermonuclease family protein [Phyllobacterium salinisoli]RCS25315.1 thermonuclease family protein [Phyllobacterium salinisoli]
MRDVRNAFRRTYRGGRWRGPRPQRSRFRRLLDWLLTIAFFALVALVVARLDIPPREREPIEGSAYAIDGDTLIIGGRHIRLQGIDAPEMKQICRRHQGEYACGTEARNLLKTLIGGRTVRCSGAANDKYRRLLGDCRVGEIDLNRSMVEKGWAVAYGRYTDEEAAARRENRGIWAGSFERPQDWRRAHQGTDETPHSIPSPLETYTEELYLWLKNLITTLYDKVGKGA